MKGISEEYRSRMKKELKELVENERRKVSTKVRERERGRQGGGGGVQVEGKGKERVGGRRVKVEGRVQP